MTFVDTNILVDVLSGNPSWAEWSVRKLQERSELGALIINDIVYAEICIGFATQSEADEKLALFGLTQEQMPRPALFLASQAFRRYRLSGGARTNVLPDFFIGAHAQTAGLTLLTRDLRRYRNYFPDVTLIAPE